MAFFKIVTILLLANYILCNPAETEIAAIRTVEDPYRLDTSVWPSHYDVTLKVEDNFGPNGSFTGSVCVNFMTHAAISEITLQANELEIDESKIELTCNDVQMYGSFRNNQTTYNLITVIATQEIENNTECRLAFKDFKGVLADDVNGFYRSSYTNEEGDVEWLGTTQFHPTHARRAFPCFDEPQFKATFQITLYHPSDYNSIFNTPLESSETDAASGLVADTFKITPRMSTYLIAFLVSKFEYLEDSAHKSRVFARKEDLLTAAYTLSLTPQLVTALEDFTGIEYLSTGIGKLDQVALPDLSVGAMENWGIITYRESNLLWEPGNSSNSYKQAITSVVAHELSHMWFGDLVTCEWWSYTWLNEGFARFFQYFITGLLEPTWEMDKQFVVTQLQVIFASDAVSSVEAITSSASTPSEIYGKFNAISYSKGACIIRMTKNFMGESNWRSGIRDYLQARKFNTAVPQDLFNALTSYASNSNLPSGRTFTDVMTIWTEQPGFPVLDVTTSGMDVVITQTRFFLNDSEWSTTKWDVPISYTTSGLIDFETTKPQIWLSATQDNITIEHVIHSENDWIILNIQETGYYRVNYDDSLWEAIEKALKSDGFGGIHVINRAQIVDDAINLARAGQLTYARALGILSYLSSETEYYPWYAASQAFSFLNRRFGQHETVGALFQEFLQSLMAKVTESVPFNQIDDSDQIYTLKKVVVLSWSCILGVEDCVQNSLRTLYNYQYNGIKVNANLRSVVYCNALRYANSSDSWHFLYNKYLETKLSTEQVTIITALGCTQNNTLISEYLLKIMSDGQFRSQDLSTVFSSVYSQSYGVPALYNFLKKYYKVLPNYYSSWASLFSNVADGFTTDAEIEDLESFLEENADDLAGVSSTIKSAINTAKVNLEWSSRYSSDLIDFFEKQFNAARPLFVDLTLLSFAAMIVLLL